MSGSQRRLAAIMFSDIVGYSKMMGDDEQRTLELLRRHNAIQLPIIEAHGGTVLKFIGDAILSSYPSAINAVRCALAVQKMLRDNAGGPIPVRIGIHIGDVVEQHGDIFGDGVNIAARVQPLAEPGGICVSRTVYDMARAQADVRMESIGVRSLKNIKEKVEIFRVALDGAKPLPVKRPWKTLAAAALAGLACLGLWTTRARWEAAFGTRAPVKRDRRFAIYVAPFHGADADALKDGQAMKTLVEERLMEQLGPLDAVRLVVSDAPPPRSKDEADALGAKLGANLVIWGQIVSLGGQTEIHPFLTMVGTSFREQESSALDIAASGKNQLELRKAEAADIANLAVISAAWYYGIVDAEQGLALIRTIAPASAESLVAEGYIRYDQKEWDEAGALFRKALALNPKSATAYNGLGNVARAHDDYAGAERYYAKAVAVHPDWPNSYYNLAQTYDMEGRIAQALGQYKLVVKLAPRDGVGHRALANAYDELGQYDKAVEEYRIAVENCKPDPNSSFGTLFYYVALMKVGKQDAAVEYARDLIKRSGLKAPNLWPYHVAWVLAGRYSEDDLLKTVEAASPGDLQGRRCVAYYFLGMRHLWRTRTEGKAELDKARDYFERCVKTDVYWYAEHRRAKAELARLPKA